MIECPVPDAMFNCPHCDSYGRCDFLDPIKECHNYYEEVCGQRAKYTVSCTVSMDYEIDADNPEEARWQAIRAFLSDVGDSLDIDTEVWLSEEDD